LENPTLYASSSVDKSKRKENALQRRRAQEQQATKDAPVFGDENDEKEKGKFNLLQVKSDICNALIYVPEIAHFLAQEPRSVVGLTQLLYRRCYTMESVREEKMTPILIALTKIAEVNQGIRNSLKKIIFGKNASAPANSKTAMGPFGKEKDRQALRNPHSLRAQLVQYITSYRINLKSVVSEFFWILANKESQEYMRLLGLGNAVGLLADKGLPGFAGLSQNAIDIDDFIRAKKAKKKKDDEGED